MIHTLRSPHNLSAMWVNYGIVDTDFSVFCYKSTGTLSQVMAAFLFKLWILCVAFIGLIHAEIAIVKPDGEQEPIKPKKYEKSKQKAPHSQFSLMWVTPFEIFNLSTPDDHTIDPSFNKVMAEYGEYLNNRFLSGIRDGSINLMGMDEKASLNDKFFALQRHLHETNNFHRSDAVPLTEFAIFKSQIKKLVKIYLKRSGVDDAVIKKALGTIDGKASKDNKDPSKQMFLWVSSLSNGSYHAPHSHQDSLVSGVYYAKIPTTKIDEASEDDVGGHLVFGDPRGAGIYPFGLKYIHVPIEGQVVLFPGYLRHWVEPVKSTETRISFSFNIPGEWDDLSDTSMFHKF